MFDVKAIRANPTEFDANWARRGLDAQTPVLLSLDQERRDIQTRLQVAQQRRNDASKDIGAIKSKGGDAAALMAEVAAVKQDIEAMEAREASVAEELATLLSALPNMIADDVPNGADETHNKLVKTWGTPRAETDVPDHVTIGESLGGISFDIAAKMSGARFVWLQGDIARLERALAQFMLDTQTEANGYTEISPPLMVKDTALYGTGQLPKFGEDLFKTTTGHYLIPTAEVSLTNAVADQIFPAAQFPMRLTAFTPCFRSEAGSAGRDTRGMIRQHQFYKVELVSLTLPEQSDAEHERMTRCAEGILEALNLPYRRMVLCSGDIGFGSRRTFDLEVWLPSQNMYREISSCSTCADFQTRRMKARFRRDAGGETEFLHSLNGSGLAVGRTLVAVLENNYNVGNGSVTIPDVLRPYMGGKTALMPVKA
ncbi:MAG: serine--tRNA ligase [Pseudomonadota bacterium]